MEVVRVHSLPPVFGPQPRVLILGSLPGAESLRLRQYYGNPRNDFWPILCTILNGNPATGYEARIALLQQHHVALWDVAASCQRLGSADATMRDIVMNDIQGLLAEEPSIRVIATNGAKATQMLTRSLELRSRRGIADSYETGSGTIVLPLPSTSAAHAAMSRQEKLRRWTLAFA